MSSRSLMELKSFAEGLGLKVRVTRKFKWDVPEREPHLAGFYAIDVKFDENPVPGAVEVRLGDSPEEARAALRQMAEAA